MNKISQYNKTAKEAMYDTVLKKRAIEKNSCAIMKNVFTLGS